MWPDFIKHYKKTIGGKDYWYFQKAVKIKGKSVVIASYVAPYGIPEEKLEKAIPVALQKFINRIFELECGERKRKYKHKYLSDYQVEILESIRFDFNYRFKELYPTAFKMYKDASYIRYVHGTTAIEGNTLSLGQTKQVLEEGLSVSGKSLREIYEVENYKRLREFIEGYNKRFDLPFIKKIHEIVCANMPDCGPGSLRKVDVEIKGTNVEPVPAGAIEFEMEALLKWFHSELEKKRHILEVACEFHQRFEEIHPFTNGNGRVGRELINYLLERHGYPPIYLEKEDRETYLVALKSGNSDDPRPLVDLYFNKLLKNHSKVLQNVKGLNLEQSEGFSKEEPKEIQTRLFDYGDNNEKNN